MFDYLDDANLIAVQYYITKFIDEYKQEGKKIYPLIMTHINPYFFKNFAFSKQKIYFLDKKNITSNPNFVKLLALHALNSGQSQPSFGLFSCDHFNPRIRDSHPAGTSSTVPPCPVIACAAA